mgnify:CR=1 FL=1
MSADNQGRRQEVRQDRERKHLLDPKRTSPYKFYQFWLNVSDDDAERYIKIFTSLDKETIDALVEEHRQDPGRRTLQRRLAEEVTVMVHSREDYDAAVEASNILFGKSTKDSLLKLDEQTFLDIFEGVPQFEVSKDKIGLPAVELFTTEAAVFASKGEDAQARSGRRRVAQQGETGRIRP